jgi:hypothetical protein
MPQLDVKPVPTLVSNFPKDTNESLTDSLKGNLSQDIERTSNVWVYQIFAVIPSFESQ